MIAAGSSLTTHRRLRKGTALSARAFCSIPAPNGRIGYSGMSRRLSLVPSTWRCLDRGARRALTRQGGVGAAVLCPKLRLETIPCFFSLRDVSGEVYESDHVGPEAIVRVGNTRRGHREREVLEVRNARAEKGGLELLVNTLCFDGRRHAWA